MTHDITDEVRAHNDELAKNGPYATLAPHNRGGAKSRYVAEVFDAALLPLLSRETVPIRLLDFGCGTGIFTVRAQPLVKEIVGVDLSPGLLSVATALAARQGLKIPFVVMNGRDIPLAEHSVNRVVAREVLSNIPDQALPGVIRELRRVLEPDGKVYLLDQVSESPHWQRYPATPNVRKRGVDELTAAFAAEGFELESAVAVRQPRFPWIYPIWFRLIPTSLIPWLAGLEVRWNRRFCPLKTRRWQNDLFIFRRKS